MTSSSSSFLSAAAAFRGGARDAFGVPAAVLGAGYIGYGALAYENGYSVWLTMFATASIWALPGQLILIELHVLGAAAFAIVLAAVVSGARFLPMTLSLLPVMRDRRYGGPLIYPVAHLVTMTTWATAMRRCPDLPSVQRMPYFAGFALICLAASVAGCPVGYYLSGLFPPLVRLGFVFLTPVYFLVILVGDARTRLAAVALVCGALAGPLFYLLSPQWSVLLSGFVGGTAAYLIQRRLRRAHA
ncbi:MAG: AzlC family ABC transporter permease [Burkholderiales bacterium]|nr:AzlC family ABC transporter permease [Burkholderiales bacterium]